MGRSQEEFMGTLAMLNPSWAKRIHEQKKDQESWLFKELVKQGAQSWNDMKTPFDKEILIDASTYNPPRLFDLPPWNPRQKEVAEGPTGKSASKHRVMCPGSDFGYMNMTLPRGQPLKIAQGHKRGQVWFDDDVVIPNLFQQRSWGSDTWMSFTPMEVYTQRAAVRIAAGRVVVGGMGLGWLLQAVCQKKSVTEVVLVEKNKALFDWLYSRIVDTFGIRKPVVTVVSDVYEFMEQDAVNHERTKYLLDIWMSYGESDSKFDKWKNKLGNRLWGWGQLAEPERRRFW